MEQKHTPDLLLEKPGKLYAKYFINSVISTAMLAVYVLFDTIFIGWSVGSDGLAALNISLPFYTILVAFALILGVGGATVMSYCKGQGKPQTANAYFTLSFTTAVIGSVLYAILGSIFWRPLAYAFGANDDIINLVGEYLLIMNASAPAYVLNNMMGVFVRNDNNPKLAMIAGVVSCFANIIFDYVTMFEFGWGMRGAVGSTVAATIMSFVILMLHFFHKSCTLRFTFKGLEKSALPRIFRNGFPSFVAECSSGLIIMLFNIRLMDLGGVDAVTSYSILSNVAYVFLAVFNGVCHAIQPLVSFNAGAGERKRVLTFFRFGLSTVFVVSSLFVAFGLLFPQYIVAMFTQPTPEVLAIAIPAIRIYFIAYIPMGFNIVTATFLQSIELSKTAAVISLCRGIIFMVPLLIILSLTFSINGVWATVPCAEFLTLAVSFFLCRRGLQNGLS